MSLGSSVASFALVAALVTIIPGLDTAMVLRSAIRHGRRHGFATALGVSCGALTWGAGAAVGISALLEISKTAYTVVRVVGAVYMVWLGSRLLLQAIRAKSFDDFGDVDGDREPRRLSRSWARGYTTNLLNPKIGAFYVSVLPQFIPAHTSHLAIGLLLAGVHDVEAMIWFSAIIFASHAARAAFAKRRTQRAIDGVTGTVLIGFGLRLGLASR
jgi:threonine/homoserine/homoserine lactone efflux protein